MLYQNIILSFLLVIATACGDQSAQNSSPIGGIRSHSDLAKAPYDDLDKSEILDYLNTEMFFPTDSFDFLEESEELSLFGETNQCEPEVFRAEAGPEAVSIYSEFDVKKCFGISGVNVSGKLQVESEFYCKGANFSSWNGLDFDAFVSSWKSLASVGCNKASAILGTKSRVNGEYLVEYQGQKQAQSYIILQSNEEDYCYSQRKSNAVHQEACSFSYWSQTVQTDADNNSEKFTSLQKVKRQPTQYDLQANHFKSGTAEVFLNGWEGEVLFKQASVPLRLKNGGATVELTLTPNGAF